MANSSWVSPSARRSVVRQLPGDTETHAATTTDNGDSNEDWPVRQRNGPQLGAGVASDESFDGAAVSRVALAPVEQCPQHRAQLFALLRQQIFGARGMLLVETPLDDPGFLEPLQSRRQRIGADRAQ